MKHVKTAFLCLLLTGGVCGCGDDDDVEACGNGQVDSNELCDDTLLDGQSCITINQGFTGGALACNATCDGWIVTGCVAEDLCGNGALDDGETCDGTQLDGQLCDTIGQGFTGGILACNTTCDGWEVDACTDFACGNYQIDLGETCDGTDLAAQDCTSIGQGFDGGVLGCNATCDDWDVTGCFVVDLCGNDQLDVGETCDGTELNSQDCTSIGQGYIAGVLGCNPTCDGWDTSGCTVAPGCGNNQLDTGETCDGTELDGQDCTSIGQGFTGGALACSAGCTAWDTAACTYDAVDNFGGSCTNPNVIYPVAGEETHFVTARLTPASYPFTVYRLAYTLVDGIHGANCDGSLAHNTELFVATTNTPPGTPVVSESFAVPAGVVIAGEQRVQLELSTPLTLQAGEHLFVSIQNAGTYPNVTCAQVCEDPGAVANRNWWSNASAPPYPWATLSSFGFNVTVTAEAYGSP